MFEKLDDNNFIEFCVNNYDNAQCHDEDEFFEDLRRIKYIKKLVTRYMTEGDLKERLILNHLIILQNVFGPYTLCKIILFKMPNQLKYIKPFLVLMNALPDKVFNVGNQEVILTDAIEMDPKIVEVLRKI